MGPPIGVVKNSILNEVKEFFLRSNGWSHYMSSHPPLNLGVAQLLVYWFGNEQILSDSDTAVTPKAGRGRIRR